MANKVYATNRLQMNQPTLSMARLPSYIYTPWLKWNLFTRQLVIKIHADNGIEK